MFFLDCTNVQETELVQIVNEYRVANGRSVLPATRWMTATAQWHVWDRIHNPGAVGGACNSHSWSSSPPIGVSWQGMCYTPDHAQAAQMWGKPEQISGNVYTGFGYENTADVGGTQTARNALLQWQGSPSHNAVILQQGVWSGVGFQNIGVGIDGPYAVLWFGDGVDPAGEISPCVGDVIFGAGFE